jgi:hypothetical protein
MAAGVSRTSVTLPAGRERSWFSLALSAALHAVILVLAVWLSRVPAEPQEEEKQTNPEERAVRMVYLPPPPKPPQTQPPPPPPPPTEKTQRTDRTPPPPPPIPRPFSPPPRKEQKTREPDANAPPEAERSKGAEPDDEKKQPERAGQPDAAPPTSELATRDALMESEAKRIFGSPKKYTPEGVGPRASRPMEAYLPDHPERCTPKEPARDSTGQPQYGTVIGRIYRQDNGRPLGGAHLQMLGTPYVSFTDDTGAYRFQFDMSLVDNCRTQYVRVTAAGYESRLLVLVVGPNAVSEDVSLKRK